MKDDGAAPRSVERSYDEAQGFAPGVVIAKRYRLEGLLGRGGMGVVWAATHTVTRRAVAIKFLRSESNPHGQELRKRFMREARAASAVKHPNVVTISDVFELDDETPVMVMDLLTGETLGQKLARESKLTLERAAALLLPVVSAVGTAHAMGIIHRDLKPDNIFIVAGAPPGEEVRVLDFGIAKVAELDGDSQGPSVITNTGAVLGTPCYMSPEQALGEPDIDHRTDIWSLGVILYECLCGVRPIQGQSVGQVVKQIISDGIRPIDEIESGLPRPVSNLIGRMLSTKRSRRPPDLNRIADVLAAYTSLRVPAFGPPERLSALQLDADADDEIETRVDGKNKPLDVEPGKVDAEVVGARPAAGPLARRATVVIIGAAILLGAVAVSLLRSRTAATASETALVSSVDVAGSTNVARSVPPEPASASPSSLPVVQTPPQASSPDHGDSGATVSHEPGLKAAKTMPVVGTKTVTSAQAALAPPTPPAASRTPNLFDNRKW
jgi:serine/threonine protein kinase